MNSVCASACRMARRVLICVASALVLLLATQPTRGDRVTPSDRVETRLRIREGADGQSAVIGHILPGDSLPLRASIPSWYEVSMPDGQSGFVSKGFSTRIPDQPTEIIGSSELRLGSWNIKKLGHGANKNFALVAQIIEARYDLLAVVEVMQKGGGHPGYDALLAQLGNGWAGVVTYAPRPDTSSGSAEFYAVLFRPVRARLCDGWTHLAYHTDNSGGAGATGTDRFSREPAFACFATTRADGSPGFDFIFAAYHAIFAEGDIDDIKGEVQHLDEVFASMAAARAGERDLVIAGDYNLVPSDLAATISQQVRTIGSGSTLNGSGTLTANLYDHLIVFDLTATSEMMGPEEIIDVRNAASSNKVFFDTVSDHLPLVARFRIDPDDD
jgi:hypothetical protein